MAKSAKTSWNPFSFHFRHKYEQGYRYLDICGEFMVRAENEFGFVCGDAQPAGAKLDHPDHGTHVELDASGLTMRQEVPVDEGETFFECAVGVANLARDLIRPTRVYYVGFAAKHYLQFPTEEAAFAASLRFGAPYYNELADSLNMTPLLQGLTYSFTSGSYELQIDLKAVAFGSVKRDIRRSYGFRPTKTQRKNVDRWNALEESRDPPAGYALFLETDLQEQDPPQDALPEQVTALLKYIEVLRKRLILTE